MLGHRLRTLARSIDDARASELARRWLSGPWEGEAPRAEADALGELVATAYPAYAHWVETHRGALVDLVREGWRAARDRGSLLARALEAVGDPAVADDVGPRLRRFVASERLRIAVRELLPPALGGADIEVTAREISDLAEVALEIAVAEARAHVAARCGEPRASSGEPSAFVVIGMGKLGGRELNAGSDVDIIFFYDTDDGESSPPGGGEPLTLHEHWSRVARRVTATVDEATEDGLVWRVDLRLRPEGSSGPIANSLPAAERYYETFGRLWERAALLRARPVAGDLAFGAALLAELSPFVYQRNVDPQIAGEMIRLVDRARIELCRDPALDVKLGPGGIRAAEFFVQSLQLIWGGREPRLRATGTLDALRRLRAHGLVTDREARELADAWALLRRVEHRIQWSTGVQTHDLPLPGPDRDRMARSLGYATVGEFERDLGRARERAASLFASLAPAAVALAHARAAKWEPLLVALELPVEQGWVEAVQSAFGPASDLARDLRALARRPDDLLGGSTRERLPDLAATLLDALVDAADPEQAARLLRQRFARLSDPGLYVRPLGEEPRALRRLVAVLGASAFLGQAIADRPDLSDDVLFSRGAPSLEAVRAEVAREVASAREAVGSEEDPTEEFVGALRRGAARITIEVGLADLAGEIGTREATHRLSALADAVLEHATRHALGTDGPVRGLALLAVGKLGGRDIGYGSDLDVLFVFDPSAAPEGVDPYEYFVRRAQRVIRLVSSPHADGPGYELDTRLRPSGSHGLLVTSLDAFARYHHVGVRDDPGDELAVDASGAPWERQALIRARFAAGDEALGAAASEVAHVAAYERGAPPPAELHRLRMRLEKELGRERRGRHDLKLGRGGLADVEFAVQFLQMREGADPRVRTTETDLAIDALAAVGHLRADLAATLRDGYRFLRRLEQRIRIVHGSSSSLLEENAPGLTQLARRMGLRDGPRGTATEELVDRYRTVTESVRRAYLDVIGIDEEQG